MVGFARQTVLGVADQVLAAVKEGKIRHIFLVGGCDGARPGRNYYTELVESIPDDCLILTLACGKYRFNKLELGEVAGFPRLLDVGQCNDAYSAIKIAAALADALGLASTICPCPWCYHGMSKRRSEFCFPCCTWGSRTCGLVPLCRRLSSRRCWRCCSGNST